MCGNVQLTYNICLGFCNHCDVVDIIYSPSYFINKQPRTTDEGWSSSLGVGRGAINPSP
jgi:hypothetical protein